MSIWTPPLRRGFAVNGLAWAGTLDPKSYMVSPIYGDLTGLGRLSIFVGTHESFIPIVSNWIGSWMP
jgi:hypothetical protein